MQPIFIIGASGHAKVVLDIVERQGSFRVAGFIDARLPAGVEHFGLPVLGEEDDLPALCKEYGVDKGIIAIGDNWTRHKVAERIAALAPDFSFASAVHPSASLGRGVEVGGGSVVMAGAVLNPDTRVGAHCIVNTGAQLDHDGVLEDFASLAPGAVAGGNCRIGGFAAVGIGAVLRHGTSVGAHAVVGAGAVVLADVPEAQVWFGVPARRIHARRPGDGYL
ncbi:acetyltransferase [Desulfocurvus sp. DL9XJH121]